MEKGFREPIRHGTEGYSFALYRMRNFHRMFQGPMHWHEETELIYVEEGILYLTIGADSYAGKEGDIFIVNSSELHSMYIDSLDSKYITMLFSLSALAFLNMDNSNKEFLMPLIEKKFVFLHEVPTSEIHERVKQDILQIMHFNEAEGVAYQLGTKVCLLDIIFQLYTGELVVKNSAGLKNSELTYSVLDYLRTHYTEDISLEEVADRFHLSQKYFSRWFKNNFRLSFVEYVTHLRISKATELLTQSTLSITEIALQCGFSSSSYFNKRFKALLGVTPREYRG